jgi:hypothetical protein
VVAESQDGKALLLGEVKWAPSRSLGRAGTQLAQKAQRFPLEERREVFMGIWTEAPLARPDPTIGWFGPKDVLHALQ